MRTIPWRHLIPRAWQRRQAPWPGTLWQVLLVAVVCGLGVLGTLEHAGAAWGATGRAPNQAPAQAMTTGQAAFQRGDFEGAAARWQAAARLYPDTNQPPAHSHAP